MLCISSYGNGNKYENTVISVVYRIFSKISRENFLHVETKNGNTKCRVR